MSTLGWLLLACSRDPGFPEDKPAKDTADADADADADSDADADTDADSDADADADSDADTDADTGTVGPPLSGLCTLADDNSLRGTCTFTDASPEELTLTLTPSDGSAPRVFAGSSASPLPIYGLAPLLEHTWVAETTTTGRRATGRLVAGAVPAEVQIRPTVSGVASFPYLMVPFACESSRSWLVVLDPAGRTRWYQDVGAMVPSGSGRGLRALHPTEDGVLVSVYGQNVLEVSYSGELRLDLSLAEGELPGPAHHDLAATSEWIFVLFAYQELRGDREVVFDGVAVYDRDGTPRGEFRLGELLPYDPAHRGVEGYWSSFFPGASSYFHANSLTFDPRTGEAILSLFAVDALVGVQADPSRPNFGELLWVVDGSGEGPLAGFDVTFEPASPGGPGFASQHHAVRQADDSITMFDNRGDDDSRGLRLGLTPTAATELESIPVGRDCPAQGSAYVLEGGQWVTTCAGQFRVDEFPAGGGEANYSLTLACPERPAEAFLYRGIPLSF